VSCLPFEKSQPSAFIITTGIKSAVNMSTKCLAPMCPVLPLVILPPTPILFFSIPCDRHRRTQRHYSPVLCSLAPRRRRRRPKVSYTDTRLSLPRLHSRSDPKGNTLPFPEDLSPSVSPAIVSVTSLSIRSLSCLISTLQFTRIRRRLRFSTYVQRCHFGR
jgi:hypothetical protein